MITITVFGLLTCLICAGCWQLGEAWAGTRISKVAYNIRRDAGSKRKEDEWFASAASNKVKPGTGSLPGMFSPRSLCVCINHPHYILFIVEETLGRLATDPALHGTSPKPAETQKCAEDCTGRRTASFGCDAGCCYYCGTGRSSGVGNASESVLLPPISIAR